MCFDVQNRRNKVELVLLFEIAKVEGLERRSNLFSFQVYFVITEHKVS